MKINLEYAQKKSAANIARKLKNENINQSNIYINQQYILKPIIYIKPSGIDNAFLSSREPKFVSQHPYQTAYNYL